MARPSISRSLRQKIAAEAQYRCGYCLTPQSFTAMPMHVEHIVPLAVGGSSTEDNLWLACPLCNGSKATQTHHVDPESGEHVVLFNPRQQNWYEHFQWNKEGIEIIGKTPSGRATVIALKLKRIFGTCASSLGRR